MPQIDFVLPWVNGSDPAWLKEKAKYDPSVNEESSGVSRYRDWDLMRYWFRAIEENAPWVRKIFFITWGHLPDFLNKDHPKLQIVRHEDYIPEQWLPTFSARCIELNLHRIADLGEHFVYFNDDTWLNRPVTEDFWFKNNLPCYYMANRPYDINELKNPYQHSRRNAMEVINRHFTTRDQLKSGLSKVCSPTYGRTAVLNLLYTLRYKHFGQFQDLHLPDPFLKSTLQEIWKTEPEILSETSQLRFLVNSGVNQYVFRYWDLARGNFVPRGIHGTRYNITTKNLEECASDIENGLSFTVCANDSPLCDDFDRCRERLKEAFKRRYPKPCSFEK